LTFTTIQIRCGGLLLDKKKVCVNSLDIIIQWSVIDCT